MLLVVETALAALSVALLDGDTIIAEHHRIVGRGHAETVMTAVADVVGDRGGAVTSVIVDIGPGSFTGLRVGIAAARGLGLAWGVPVTGVGSLTLIAAAAFAADPGLAALAVAVDAGRGQLYVQRFDRAFRGGPAVAATAGITLPPGLAVAGSGAALIGGDRLRPAIDLPRAADARSVPPPLRALPPVPLYLRAPDAVPAVTVA